MTNDVHARTRLIPTGERPRVRIVGPARLNCELGAAGIMLDDVGCDEAMAVLHIYVDLAAAALGPPVSGRSAAQLGPCLPPDRALPGQRQAVRHLPG